LISANRTATSPLHHLRRGSGFASHRHLPVGQDRDGPFASGGTMIVLYTVMLLALGVVNFLVARRVKSLEKKFTRVSLAASKLANLPPRAGNGARADVCTAAKQQLGRGRRGHQRARLEAGYYRWKRLGDRLMRWPGAARHWKGCKLPYTLGVVDVSMVMYLI